MEQLEGQKIEWSEQLWRYFGTERFLELLSTSSLYFAAATQFEDNFEGAVAIQDADFPVDPRYAKPDPTETAFEELKRLTKISCWHIANFESDAMWKLYANLKKGIAITTTPERLKKALTPYRIKPEYAAERTYCGNVTYVDLLAERLKTGMLPRFYYKHRAFEWEREFRLAISLRSAEEFGVNVPEKGISVQLDLNELIDKIYVGPALSSDHIEKVKEACQAAGLSKEFTKSSLLGRPRFI